MVTDFFNVVCNVFIFLWDAKIQFLGGFFIALTSFEYFYRKKIEKKKIEKLDNIKYKINKIKLEVMSDKRDLEHEILELKIKKIAYENSVNNKAIIVQLNSEFEVVNLRLDNINQSVDQTNLKLDDFIITTDKELTAIKKEIEPVKIMKKIPKWGYLLAFIGLTVTLNFKQFMDWVNKLLPW